MSFSKKGYENKGYVFKKVANTLLKNIEEKNIQSLPLDLKKFIDEAKNLDEQALKIYSPERALKLYGLLLFFTSTHNIELDDDIRSILFGFKNVLSSDIAICYGDAFERVYSLLENCPYRDFMEARLYFINEETRNALVGISDELQSHMKLKTDFKKYNFNKIANFFNSDLPAHKYTVTYKAKYQYISKPESIAKYLPAHYEITKNVLVRNNRELLNTHTFSESTKKHIEEELKTELLKIDQEYAFIMELIEKGCEDIDVKILSYEHSGIYPELKFFPAKNGTKYFHLKSGNVNVLWYVPVQIKKDSDASEVTKNYTHAFGDVYYQFPKK